ncbi:unnamed protein product [Moneuplotes crassus]|uniref:N-formylglutamate amidohydrolase n=1 Tax=Euplotes crassus TaxID=5936 RepID=A0AAD1UDK1_EUPCR|nr:unnamed protein product [Moneuplotes crassus]
MNRLRKILSKLRKPKSGPGEIEAYKSAYNQLSLANPFRQLTGKENEAVIIMDNRELFKSDNPPNNSVFLTCPHASKDIKYMPLNNLDDMILYSQNAYDIGAFELTNDLSESLQCVALLSNFCKLLIDPNKSIASKHLVPDYVLHHETIDPEFQSSHQGAFARPDGKMGIEMNRRAIVGDRLDYYYIEYHKLVGEALAFLEPQLHIDIHTYECLSNYFPDDASLMDEESIGIQVYSKTENNFIAEALQDEDSGLKVFTDPFIPSLSHHQCGTFTLDSVADYDLEGTSSIQSLQLSIPNHWAMDSEFRLYLIEILTSTIQNSIKTP